MAFIDEVKSRIPSNTLIQLTNANDQAASVISSGVLINAITDTQNYFQIESGEIFDATKTLHITIGIAGVIYFLNWYKDTLSEAIKNLKERWDSMIYTYRITYGNNARIKPATLSPLSPTSESTKSGQPPKPAFDISAFLDYRPDMPYNQSANWDATDEAMGYGGQ